jgi:glutathione synthase/RimK-type ligase-like ATP-grasp enzyme
MKIGFATCEDILDCTADDRLLINALARCGIVAAPLVWSRSPQSEEIEAIVIRSCWDYHLRPDDFVEWLIRLTQRGIPIINPARLIDWNLNKRYLLELAAAGVSIPQTIWAGRGAAPDLAGLLEEHGIAEAVVKPAVSLSAYQTWRITRESAAEHQDVFSRYLAERDMLIQRFLPQVVEKGEVSLMFFGGEYSHSVIKRPARGDFRVQEDFGGTRAPFRPAAALVEQATAILARITPQPVFARVDGVDVGGELVLMEVELIDPVLFFAYEAAAPARCAAAIARWLDR